MLHLGNISALMCYIEFLKCVKQQLPEAIPGQKNDMGEGLSPLNPNQALHKNYTSMKNSLCMSGVKGLMADMAEVWHSEVRNRLP